MKLEQYKKATPLVTSIDEAQEMLTEIEKNAALLKSCGSVKIMAYGKDQHRNVGKTFNFKNPQVQALVLSAMRTALQDMIKDHKKQLEQI